MIESPKVKLSVRALVALRVVIALSATVPLLDASWQYPETPAERVVHQYGNVLLPDDFAWMEEKEDPRTEPWFRTQDAFARSTLASIPVRDEILARLREIDDSREVLVYNFARVGERYFYLKQETGQEVGLLYFRDGIDGTESRILDPADFGHSDNVYSVQHYRPSPDGKLVAVGIAASGSEIPDTWIVETETGEVVGAPIPRNRVGGQWLDDSSGFFYTQMRPLDPGEDPVNRFMRQPVRFHKPGGNPDDDPVVVSYDSHPDLGFDPVDIPVVVPVPGTSWIILFIIHGVDRSRTVFFADLNHTDELNFAWENLTVRDDRVESLAVEGDRVFLLSSLDAPRRKILSGNLRDFNRSQLEVVIPESNQVIESIASVDGQLLFITMDGGIDRLWRIPVDSIANPASEVSLPLIGRVTFLQNDPHKADFFVSLTSWSQSPSYYRWNPATETLESVDLRPLGKYDRPEGIIVERHLVSSHDGVLVPLTVIYKEGTAFDGTNPVLLNGYGAYGSPRRPAFNPLRLAWLERGGIFAVAHVRGGGEFGREWHRGGHLERKRNTWLDFHACAEFLIQGGYTSPKHLGAMGGSMGGVLVGRAMTDRPELYGAIVSSVGNHNPVRNHRRANGPANYPEYGNPTDPEEFPYVLAMDSFFAVRDGVHYPPMLLTSGYNDARVDPWMPGKMAARLQQANPQGGPYLMRVEFRAGHGGVARSDILLEMADIYAFLYWQLGS